MSELIKIINNNKIVKFVRIKLNVFTFVFGSRARSSFLTKQNKNEIVIKFAHIGLI